MTSQVVDKVGFEAISKRLFSWCIIHAQLKKQEDTCTKIQMKILAYDTTFFFELQTMPMDGNLLKKSWMLFRPPAKLLILRRHANKITKLLPNIQTMTTLSITELEMPNSSSHMRMKSSSMDDWVTRMHVIVPPKMENIVIVVAKYRHQKWQPVVWCISVSPTLLSGCIPTFLKK